MVEYPPYAKVREAKRKKVIDNIFLRNRLEIDIDDEATNTILYILMNPSKADQSQCDETVKKILAFTREQTSLEDNVLENVKTVVIMNLFPFYEPIADKLYVVLNYLKQKPNDGYQKLMEQNMKKIQKEIQSAEYIVFGWGDYPKNVNELYHRRLTSNILDAVRMTKKKNTFVFGNTRESVVTNKGNPRHPKYIKLTGLTKCEITPIYMVKPTHKNET